MKSNRKDLAAIIAGRVARGALSKHFLTALAAQLLREGTLRELPSLIRDVQAKWAQDGTVVATVTSARSLSPEAKQALRRTVRAWHPDATHVALDERRDSALIGGVKLATSAYSVDLSIKRQLARLKAYGDREYD